jgi:hypothetical protein
MGGMGRNETQPRRDMHHLRGAAGRLAAAAAAVAAGRGRRGALPPGSAQALRLLNRQWSAVSSAGQAGGASLYHKAWGGEGPAQPKSLRLFSAACDLRRCSL